MCSQLLDKVPDRHFSLEELKGIAVSSAEALLQFLMFSSTVHEGRIKLRPWLSLGFGLCSRVIKSNTLCLLPGLLQAAAKAVTRTEQLQQKQKFPKAWSKGPLTPNDINIYRLSDWPPWHITERATHLFPLFSTQVSCFTLFTIQLLKLY